MPITLPHERENIYRLEIRGALGKAEFEQGEAMLAAEVGRLSAVKLLVVLTGFEGWQPHADWNDLTFVVKHGDAIERIAIVGDPKWRSEALMFAAAGLRKAPQFFQTTRLLHVPGSQRDTAAFTHIVAFSTLDAGAASQDAVDLLHQRID